MMLIKLFAMIERAIGKVPFFIASHAHTYDLWQPIADLYTFNGLDNHSTIIFTFSICGCFRIYL